MTDSNVGARRGRSIRDNIFVLNAIQNQIVKKKLKGIDVRVYGIRKCLDKLWAKECINNLYKNCSKDDKSSLLHFENLNTEVAIKVSSGITKRFTISDAIMQGTVWGSLMCTSNMDGLAKDSYDQPQYMYN